MFCIIINKRRYIWEDEGTMINTLSTKEKHVIQSYIREMLALFQENDMLKEEDSLYLLDGKLVINKEELLLLERKIKKL